MRLGEPMTQNHKTVILEKQARQSILMGLLKDRSTITETNFVSLNVFLNTLIKDERNEDWFKCVALLEKEAQNFSVLKTILSFPITSESLLEFIQLMADEGWTLDQLPTRNKKEEELKKVIQLILSHEGFDRRFRQWEKASHLELSTTEINDNFYSYPIYKRIKSWEKQGLKINAFSNKKTQVKAYYANNPRSEAQACVQMILEEEMAYEDQVIVCMDTNQQSQVESFLIDYKVPYFRVNEHKANSSFRLIQDLIILRQDPSNKNLISLIQNDLVDLTDRLSLMEYLRTFRFNVSDVLNPLNHVEQAFKNSNVKELLGGDKSTGKFERLEKKAERGLSRIRKQLNQLMELDPSNYESFISSLFDLFIGFFKGFSDEEVESINKIKQSLERAHPSFKSMKDPYPHLLFALSKLTLSNKQAGGVILSDLKHAFIPNKKRVFILGCTQEFYPQNPVNVGLFDDDYRLSIVNDVKERYDYHKNSLIKLSNSFEEVIYSYPLGSLDGKKKEVPNELSAYFNQDTGIAQRWKLIEKDKIKTEKTIRLSIPSSEALFFSKKELYGSVSSLEKFFHCPYQYFLTTGIGLRRAECYTIDSGVLGTLYHFALEKGIDKDQKDYAKRMHLNEAQILDPLFEDLKVLYPKQNHEIDLMKNRAINLIRLSLEFLKDREENSVFVPYKVEENFNKIIDTGKDIKLHLNGYIDRIDKTTDGFMVIDYKSSTKKMNEANVMMGLQLQLATYMWMCDQYLELGLPYGAYYFSFGQEKQKMTALSYDLRSKEIQNSNDLESAWFKGRRLCGWTTAPITKIPGEKKAKVDSSDYQKIDSNAQHIVGWSIRANGDYSIREYYDPSKIYEHLEELYGSMIDELSQAKIEKRNLGSSCQYCDYKHFCQFKGKVQKVPKVTQENAVLRMEK
jgi:ATP-dependent helicase/DNAse subunit B